MSFSIWLSFFSYTVLTALSPGPNNILALSVSGRSGIKQSRNILLGIYAGFFCVMILCGAFSAALARIIPSVIGYLKYIGAAYILWLAYHVAVSKPAEPGATNADIGHSFWKGFFLQFVNFKIILWGITAFTSFILPYYSDVSVMIGFVFLLTVIGDGATHIWAVAGTVLSGLLKKHWRTANIGMAVILVICAVQLVLE